MPPVSGVHAKTEDVASLGRVQPNKMHNMAKNVARMSAKLMEETAAFRKEKAELTKKLADDRQNYFEQLESRDAGHRKDLIGMDQFRDAALVEQAKKHKQAIKYLMDQKERDIDQIKEDFEEDKRQLEKVFADSWKDEKKIFDNKWEDEKAKFDKERAQWEAEKRGLISFSKNCTKSNTMKKELKVAGEKVRDAEIRVQRIKDKAARKIENAEKDAEREIERMRNKFKKSEIEAKKKAEYQVEQIQFKYSHSEVNKRKKDRVADARQDKNRFKNRIECVEKCLDRKSQHVAALSNTIAAFNDLNDGSHFIEAQKCFAGEIGKFIEKPKSSEKPTPMASLCGSFTKLTLAAMKPAEIKLD